MSHESRSERGIYVASRVRHAEMWKRHRAEGSPIISTWIDEAGEGETPDFGELWARIRKEIASCRALVFYGTAEDAPWKGAFVEVGMALAMGKRVYLVYPDKLDGRTMRPLGSWILDHDNVIRVPFVEVALWRVMNDNSTSTELPAATCADGPWKCPNTDSCTVTGCRARSERLRMPVNHGRIVREAVIRAEDILRYASTNEAPVPACYSWVAVDLARALLAVLPMADVAATKAAQSNERPDSSKEKS